MYSNFILIFRICEFVAIRNYIISIFKSNILCIFSTPTCNTVFSYAYRSSNTFRKRYDGKKLLLLCVIQEID